MTLALPQLDGQLELRGLLGEGGMGQVYRAWDGPLERAVAVKFVRGTDPVEAERLLLEARLQARIDHPNVVRVHEVGTLQGRPCIVMQLVEGDTLGAIGPEAPLRVRVQLLREAALGLHAAHLQGLIHRDMKPGNVLVETLENDVLHALVSDFGLARDEEGGLTRTGLPAGTLDFMAPELLLGAGPIDFRVDVYALGATAYALFSGHYPFRATTAGGSPGAGSRQTTNPGDSTQVLRRILEEDPAPLEGVPSDLRTIVAKAMEKAPADRYASAEAFAEDLERFLKGEPILAHAATALDRLLKWGRRNPTAASASVAALLAIILGLGYGFWTTRRAARQSLESARLGALAESFEASLRVENLAPAHDLSDVLATVKAEAERLNGPSEQSGPAAFARGRALELLGEWDRGREAYQQAWDRGYRSPQTAGALGLSLIRVHDQELRRARATLAPTALKSRQAHLERTLRDPALALLAKGDPKDWRLAWAQALLAMLEDDFEAARRQAQALRTRDAQRYEAWTLEGEAWIAEAGRRAQEGRFTEAGQALDQALAPLERSLGWGRSDHRSRAAMAALCRQRAILAQAAGRNPSEETRTALGWIEQALALTPDNPDLLMQKAAALHQYATSPYSGTLAGRGLLIEQAIRLLEKADTLRPKSPRILQPLANYWAGYSQVLFNQGQSGRPALEQGLARLREVAPLAPQDPTIPQTEVFLRNREIAILRAENKDAEPAIRAGLAAAERALQLETVNPAPIQAWKIQVQLGQGREAWLHGRDPRPDLMAAAARAESLAAQAPGNLAQAQASASALWTAADQLTDLEGEVDRLLSSAIALMERGLAQAPRNELFHDTLGSAQMVLAYWRCIHDQDPSQALAAARAGFTRANASSKGMVMSAEQSAVLSLVEARWQVHQGRSPEAALAEVERRLTPLLKVQASSNAGVRQNLAIAALVRGQWAQRQGRPFAMQARKGLDLIAGAIQLDSGDPALRVVEARLHALAGDGAASGRSLGEARRLNPLIERGAEYRRAFAESSVR